MIEEAASLAQVRGNRVRRAGIGGLSGVAAQVLNLAVLLLTVPLASHYLGKERYGVWVTIMSAFTLLAVTDLGVSSSLVLALAESNARDDREGGRRLVATAFWSLVGVALVVGTVAALLFSFIPWQVFFNTSSAVAQAELGQAATAALIVLVLSIPLTVVSAVYQAHQETYISNAWAIAGSLIALGVLVVVVRSRGGLSSLILAFAGTELAITGANAAYLFVWHRPWLRPAPRAVSVKAFRRLRGLGAKYLVVRAAELGMFQSQPLIVAQVLGASQVGVFYIAYRLFNLPSTVIVLLTNPLVAAYAEARAKGDWRWIWATLVRTTVAAAVFTAACTVVLFASARVVISFWAGPSLSPSQPLILALAAYGLLNGFITPIPVLLYGTEKVGAQAVIATGHALITIIGGVILMQSLGLPGMVVAMLIAVAGFNMPLQLREVRLLFRSTELARASV